MNKIILILSVVFCFLFTGCAVSRTTSQRATTTETSDLVRSESKERGVRQIVTEHTDQELGIITTVEEFDTTKPTDPTTGTPPLKRRETTTTQALTKGITKAETNIDENQETTEESARAIRTNEETTQTQHTETVGKSGWFWFKIGLCVALLVVVLILVFRKRFNNFLKPF